MRCGERLLVFDGGSGLRDLGGSFNPGDESEFDIFLTHTHHDHIVGVPFFAPLFNPRNKARLWAGHLPPKVGVHDVLCRFMGAPLFPIPPQVFAADLTFHDFMAGDRLSPCEDVVILTAPLNHPNGASGYRVEFDGKAICYVTDTEHEPGKPDQGILDLIAGANILIYDCTYTEQEFVNFQTWGHSTWEEGARLCDIAGVEQLVIFHHDPGHDDDFMDKIAEQAARKREGTVVAREGMVLRP